MTERRANFHFVIISRRFFVVEGLEVSNLAFKQLRCSHILIVRNSEDSMLTTAKDGNTFWLILVPKRLMHDSKSAFTFNCQPNKYSDGSKIAFDEVWSAIKWIDPYYSFICVKCLEKLAANFVGSICLSQLVLDNIKPLLMAIIKMSHINKSFDLFCYLIWFYCWVYGVSRLFAFFTLNI